MLVELISEARFRIDPGWAVSDILVRLKCVLACIVPRDVFPRLAFAEAAHNSPAFRRSYLSRPQHGRAWAVVRAL